VSRILIYQSHPSEDEGLTFLGEQGYEVVSCHDREALFGAMAERRPNVLIYVLDELSLDLVVLSMLRRRAPRLPIILLGRPAGIEARRSVQDLKPTYYGVFPLEPTELADAVRGALGLHGRAGTST
jgi:DNA-binding NarL/FixJ family response regulator